MRVKSADNERFSLAPVFRLSFFLAVVCVVAGAVVLRSARADVAEALWEVGSRVMEFPGAPVERTRQLLMNGVQVSFRTQTVDVPFADVLAHYESNCGTPNATQSARNDHAGYVACLDVGDASNDLGTLARRLLRFSETGDLRDLGDPRYVLARRVASAAKDTTFLLTMWVESAFNLYQMLPRPGADAAGSDLVGVPRLPGSQRILSASEVLGPSGVVVYWVATQSAYEVESFYRTELPENGWTILERNPSESIQVDGTRLLFAEKNNRLVTVLARPGEASPTLLTILASEPS
jgi:hypothetical protein